MAIVAAIYILSILIGTAAFRKASPSMADPWALLLADVVSTVVVWCFGLLYRNVSVYDPYWSVAPPARLLI